MSLYPFIFNTWKSGFKDWLKISVCFVQALSNKRFLHISAQSKWTESLPDMDSYIYFTIIITILIAMMSYAAFNFLRFVASSLRIVQAYCHSIYCVCPIGLTTGAYCRGRRTLFTPEHAAPECPVTEILSQYIVLGRLLGHVVGKTSIVYPGTRRSRSPCDKNIATVHCAAPTTGAYCRENDYISPGHTALPTVLPIEKPMI